MSPWHVTADPVLLRHMGKLLEELGELQAVAARVIIQGLDEIDPGSGQVNRYRLTCELADVSAQVNGAVQALKLDAAFIAGRVKQKEHNMAEWAALVDPAPTSRPDGHAMHERDDDLAHCKVCGGAEASLPTECPGVRMTPEQEARVYAGFDDFVNGAWRPTPPEVPL